jgi:hypothetical protein
LLNVPAVLRVDRRKYNVALLYDYSTYSTLSVRWPYLDALVLFGVYFDSKFCHSLLEIVSVRVPNRNFRDVIFFIIDLKYCNFFPPILLRLLIPPLGIPAYSMERLLCLMIC